MLDCICTFCKTPFVSKRIKIVPKYCSDSCCTSAWYAAHPDEANAKSKRRRKEQPKWFRENEPRYYKTYRSKTEASRPWRYLFMSARSRAREKGIPFELTDEWASARWTGRCEITGVAFRVNSTRGPHPFSPSIDRKNPALGYTFDNARFILWGCNAIKGVGSEEDMITIARAIVVSTCRKDSPFGRLLHSSKR